VRFLKNILITGGAGFIGANFVHHTRKRRTQSHIIVLDMMTYASNRDNFNPLEENKDYIFIKGNICDKQLVENIFRQYEIDTVVNFAAESHVDRSIENPDAFIQSNIVGTYTLLESTLHAWKDNFKGKLFHHISTDEVYGSLTDDEEAFSEKTQYAPNSPYSASKAASDHLVRSYNKTYKLPVTISNCSNNYGPFQHSEKLIPMAAKCLLEGKSVPIYGKGLNVRDWLYVEDHCRAISMVLEEGQEGEVYNVGGGEELRNIDLVNTLCDIVDKKFSKNSLLKKAFPACPAVTGIPCSSLITYVKDRAGHDHRYAINYSKINKDIGYEPSYSFEQGIDLTIDWLIKKYWPAKN